MTDNEQAALTPEQALEASFQKQTAAAEKAMTTQLERLREATAREKAIIQTAQEQQRAIAASSLPFTSLKDLSPMLALATRARVQQLLAEGMSEEQAVEQALEQVLSLAQKMQVTFDEVVDASPRHRRKTPVDTERA